MVAGHSDLIRPTALPALTLARSARNLPTVHDHDIPVVPGRPCRQIELPLPDRRPYRVVFAAPPNGHNDRRRGTIVARDAGAAHHEARNIARAGRTAEVHYVAEDGNHQVLAVYGPDDIA